MGSGTVQFRVQSSQIFQAINMKQDGERKKLDPIDLDAYLRRIGLARKEVSLKYLRQVHHSHLLSIPYENLDFHYNKPIILNVNSLQKKIIDGCRGGIGYELNILFHYLISHLGFDSQLISARTFTNSEFSPEFEHLVVLVNIENELYLCDVGYGDHMCFPKRLVLNEAQLDYTRYFRFEHDADKHWLLRVSNDNSYYQTVYRFTEFPRALIEFIPRCNQVQESLDSVYRQEKFITQLFPEGRITLSSQKLIINLKGEVEEKAVLNEDAFLAFLEHHFGIRVDDLLRQRLD